MTIPDFLQLLRTVGHEFDWSLSPDTGHANERRSRVRFHLRGSPRRNPALVLGPLQALAYARTGKVFESDAWTEAAEALRMALSDAAALVAAATDRTWAGTEGQRTRVKRLLGIRRQLLEAVGVDAPDEDLEESSPLASAWQ